MFHQPCISQATCCSKDMKPLGCNKSFFPQKYYLFATTAQGVKESTVVATAYGIFHHQHCVLNQRQPLE
jgi:hypothetical protein